MDLTKETLLRLADNAIAELLVHVPSDAKLWLAGRDDVDLALAAEAGLRRERRRCSGAHGSFPKATGSAS